MGYAVPCAYISVAGVMELVLIVKSRLLEGAVAIATYNVILVVGVNVATVAKFA
jgi:hypothetical protein